MRIQGPHPSINTYKQLQQQQIEKKKPQQKDQVDISEAAIQMQKGQSYKMERAEYVREIKNLVQSGEYKIEPEIIAKKIIDFWS